LSSSHLILFGHRDVVNGRLSERCAVTALVLLSIDPVAEWLHDLWRSCRLGTSWHGFPDEGRPPRHRIASFAVMYLFAQHWHDDCRADFRLSRGRYRLGRL
jgi:hypothetical protein